MERSAHRLGLLVLAVAWVGCSHQVRQFDGEIVWHDPDRRPIERPEPQKFPADWDLVDKLALRPLTEATRVEPPGPAVNANALGGVPDSSWYTNRLTRRRLDGERIARGACDGPMPDGGTWQLIRPRSDADD